MANKNRVEDAMLDWLSGEADTPEARHTTVWDTPPKATREESTELGQILRRGARARLSIPTGIPDSNSDV
jgi:hypothetical protein